MCAYYNLLNLFLFTQIFAGRYDNIHVLFYKAMPIGLRFNMFHPGSGTVFLFILWQFHIIICNSFGVVSFILLDSIYPTLEQICHTQTVNKPPYMPDGNETVAWIPFSTGNYVSALEISFGVVIDGNNKSFRGVYL